MKSSYTPAVHINKNYIMELLAANYLDCHDIDSICVAEAMVLCNYIEEIVVSTIRIGSFNEMSYLQIYLETCLNDYRLMVKEMDPLKY